MGLISRVSSRTYRYIFNHADFRENSHWKNHHPRGRAIRHHRECQVQDPGQRRHPARSTTINFLVNNSKTDEPCPTTTSRKSPPFIWFSDSEVVSSSQV